jgi:hypothetical protein
LCPGLQEVVKRNIAAYKTEEKTNRAEGIGSYGRTTNTYGDNIAITCGPGGLVKVLRPGLKTAEVVTMPQSVGSKIKGLRNLIR